MMLDMKTEMMNALTETIHATMESQWNEYSEEDNYNRDNEGEETKDHATMESQWNEYTEEDNCNRDNEGEETKDRANAVDVDSLVQNFTTPTPTGRLWPCRKRFWFMPGIIG
jgi:hypothetical protein